MVTSLFSTFEPSSYLYLLTWVSPFFLLGLCLSPYSLSSPILVYMSYLPQSILKPELDTLLTSSGYTSLRGLFYYLWVYVFILNLIGLSPYIFTCTSHISLTCCLALSLWVAFLQYGWGCSPGSMLKALVPRGTPLVLMPFIVLIESIRITIRPVTLSVRLTANIIAGHLLLRLCARGFERVLSVSVTFLCQTMLITLEVAVAAIQAYVFTILVSLYSKETFMRHCLGGPPAPQAGVLFKLSKHGII